MKLCRRRSQRAWLPLAVCAVVAVNVNALNDGASGSVDVRESRCFPAHWCGPVTAPGSSVIEVAQASDAPPPTGAIALGQELFQGRGTCGACHTIGGGRLVGPDLAEVNARRSEDWLVSFIRSSQSLIGSGDVDAVAVYEEYAQMPMPDALVSDDEILAILGYIAAQSPGAASGGPERAIETAPSRDAPPSAPSVALGQALFQGNVRFANGGATCNACHDVADDAVIGGGILARELTDVFARMGGPGVQAILGRPPFPVMQAAYADRPLTADEIDALVAFLRRASETSGRLPRDYGLGLFSSGVAGAVLVFGSCSLIWRRRKKGSVNQAIYDRQIKSQQSR